MVKCDKTNRRKTLDEFALEAEGNEEEASLSLFDLLCIGIGGTVGSGVFVLTGEVYPVAGPSSALCWMIAGGVCLLVMMKTRLNPTRRGRTVACSRWNSKPSIRPVKSIIIGMSRMMTKQVSALSPTCSGRLPGSRGAEVGGLRKKLIASSTGRTWATSSEVR